MGFFTRTDEGPVAPAGSLTELTNDALREVLDGWEAAYRVDEDGDIAGYWDGHLFFFFRAADGEVLHVRGRWMRDVGAEGRTRLLELANAWNAEHLFPKAYVRDEERDGAAVASVYAELNVPLREGVSTDQLDVLLSCALGTSLDLFGSLDAEFPQAAAAAAAAQEARAAADG